jgi:hypothetical protein
MKGNIIGFHTYPLVEPAVWVGLVEDVNADGTVTTGYPTTWSNSLHTAWGYNAMNTSSYQYGTAGLYEDEW